MVVYWIVPEFKIWKPNLHRIQDYIQDFEADFP